MPGSLENESQRVSRQDNLIDLLKKFRASKATDERDKIFALHDLSCEPLNHRLLRPDYTHTLPEVVQNTIRYWFESTTVTIHQVIDFLVDFEAVDTIYLVPPGISQTERETVRIPLQSDRDTIVECVRVASLFLLEQSGTKSQGALHIELDQLRVRLSKDPIQSKSNEDLFEVNLDEGASKFLKINQRARLESILRIVSWPGSRRNLHFLVTERPAEALLLAGLSGCKQICGLIADGCTDNKQELLQSTLHYATASGYWTVLKLLLSIGLDANTRLDEETILQRASLGSSSWGPQSLLQRRAIMDTEGRAYVTALQAASFKGDQQIVHLLLKKSADVNAQGGLYCTALQAASLNGYLQIVQLLLEKGADINARGGRYDTALQAASYGGHLQIIQLLLEKGADVNANGAGYGTALQAASSTGNLQVVQLLLDKGADVNARGGQHVTALQAASFNGHWQVWQMLYDLVYFDTQDRQDLELLRTTLIFNDLVAAYDLLAGYNKTQVISRLNELNIEEYEEFPGGLVRFRIPERSQRIYFRLSKFSE